MLGILKKIIPKQIFHFFQPTYHYVLARTGTVVHGRPSQHLNVIGVTGTKGKSSTVDLIASILETAGHTVARTSTIHFVIGAKEEPNLHKMTMPGRFFLQSFLKKAHQAGCSHAVVEMTSEGAKLHRHVGIDLDSLIFTNLTPEHIEAHGSFEAYRDAKLKIRDSLAQSPKTNKVVVANTDDKHGDLFLQADNAQQHPFTLEDAHPYRVDDHGITLTYRDVVITSSLRGKFNLYNILAAATYASSQGIEPEIIKKGIERVSNIRGRVEFVRTDDESIQPFDVVVDYAHTLESLEALYKAFPKKHKVCVLGSTGGGRDSWKRPKMGELADSYCDAIVLTDEDPYDEDPSEIVEAVAEGIEDHTPEIIMDRRAAIRRGIELANEGSVVLISGKGTDPYIMGPKGSKKPWSDHKIAKEELTTFLHKARHAK